MGMDVNMLACVRALAENRIQDAKKYAFCCCANDNTKKNESQVRRYKNLLLNGPNMIELPANLNGLLRMEDVSGFHAERYYLGKTQWDLFEKIKRGVAVTLKLREYGIPYKNSTLIYGVPGTGKTEFARYVAYSLGIPYAYINFSFLIDSFMGNTSKNIQRVFEMMEKFLAAVDESLLSAMEIVTYARENHTQAEVTGHLIEVLTRKVSQEVDVEAALEALKSGNERTDNWENFSNQN